LQARQTVDARGVLARPVCRHPRLPLAPGRFNELFAGTHSERRSPQRPQQLEGERRPIVRRVTDPPQPPLVDELVTQTLKRVLFDRPET
jgi:hypothetical protein